MPTLPFARLTSRRTRRAPATICLALCLAVGLPATAATEPTDLANLDRPVKKRRKATVHPKGEAHPRAIFDKGSAETTAERDRRLKRECKGRPNAGACLGYAS